jgi:hypothetical protein
MSNFLIHDSYHRHTSFLSKKVKLTLYQIPHIELDASALIYQVTKNLPTYLLQSSDSIIIIP